MTAGAVVILLGLVAVAGGFWYLRSTQRACVPYGKRVVLAVGDSLTASGQWSAELQRLLPQGSRVIHYGYVGKGTEVIRDKLADILATNTEVTDLVILAGVNDLPGARDIYGIAVNLGMMWAAGQAAGLRVVAVGLTPWGRHSNFNPLCRKVNAWILAHAPIMVRTDALGSSTGVLDRRFDAGDGLHLNLRGQAELGRLIYTQAFQTCR